MNNGILEKLYLRERESNQYFREKYDYQNPETFNKLVLEMIMEINELAYETKCFKYWKDEKMSSAEITIHELADCFVILFSLCDLANIDVKEITSTPVSKEPSLVKEFISLTNLASQITMDLDHSLLLNILSKLKNVKNLLGFSDAEYEQFLTLKHDR